MRVFMTGGTGFVGTFLGRRLTAAGHQVTVLAPEAPPEAPPAGLAYLAGHPTVPGPWQAAVAGHDVLINLAGASIFSRWTPARKALLRSSRIETTRNLVDALPADAAGVTLLSTSAVGYYGFCGDEALDEGAPSGDDFLARLARDWEAEALRARGKGARVVLTRFGIVLGRDGGALGQMTPLFRLGLGGPLGHGRQWFSWIHQEDLAEACLFLIGRPGIDGPVNLCAPDPVRNRDLAAALGRVLRRPAFLPAPGFMIRLVLGEFGSVLLEGQRAVPRRLLAAGYPFRYPGVEGALRSLLA